MDNASAKVVMLGTTYKFNGPIKADKDGFYIDYIPVTDEEGNTGSMTGSIYHNDYKDWNGCRWIWKKTTINAIQKKVG
ncbi:MAG: hypothetical protein R2779_07645 [Crocinitomicaceae bacterium]